MQIQSKDQALIALCSTPDSTNAKKLASGLVEAKLAACVQILPPMLSIYQWDEKICQETEHLLVIKTLEKKWQVLEEYILEKHPYAEPELIGIPAVAVTKGYENWLTSCLPEC